MMHGQKNIKLRKQ